jgi:hypothetical protein
MAIFNTCRCLGPLMAVRSLMLSRNNLASLYLVFNERIAFMVVIALYTASYVARILLPEPKDSQRRPTPELPRL